MADLILIPVVLLFIIGTKRCRNGFKLNYLEKEKILALKGMCALSIVLLHVGGVTQAKIMPEISAFAVSVFFFLSGYGMITSLKTQGSAYLEKFVPKHAIKLGIPFISAAVLYVLYFLYAQNNYGFKYYDEYSVTLKGVLLAFFEHGYTIVVNSWFVIALFVFYLLFFVSFKGTKNLKDGAQTFAFLVIIFTVFMFYLAQYRGWYTAWYMQNFSIIVGILYGLEKDHIDNVLKKHSQIIVCSLGIILFSLLAAFGVLKYSTDIGGYFNVAEYCTLNPIIPICVIIAYSEYNFGLKKFWDFIGDNSYELYLIHGLFYYMFQMGRLKIENMLLLGICTIVVSIIVAFILNKINKPIVKLLMKTLKKQEIAL